MSTRLADIRERARVMKERHFLPEDDDITFLLSVIETQARRIETVEAAWPTGECPLPE